MVKLSKKKALIICRDLWTWMKDEKKDDEADKHDWPSWERNGGDIGIMTANCPCCHYVFQLHGHDEFDCDSCPLRFLWPDGCESIGSPYDSFECGEGTPEDAQKIIDACNEELEKLDA